ncbi:MAG: D-alanyl-D-alanine carboxypeptidase family protein [Candidatus Eisenbacteria bacterium]|uniref:serine-type D-Ala-D-Ala carboxypeptidase n=1 Tax=Eiseniibacteriota bacterium TaxID=2212470 RepID=A0A956M1L0_UNCEI|nr:D-alanyl-D-alanine carboxypeptidase [Candidatus Eisenbacteria bacterium]
MRDSRFGRRRGAHFPALGFFVVRHGALIAVLGLVAIATGAFTSGCGSGNATVTDTQVDHSPLLQFVGRPLELDDPGCAAAILIEPETNTVLYDKGIHEKRPPASIVKMMVEMVVMREVEAGRVALTDSVHTSAWASRIGGSQVYLAEGEVFALGDLMKAIAISSANDACVAVAEHVAGSVDGFVAMMNHEVQALNLQDTHYENVHGLDDDPSSVNYTTAYDISQLGRELLHHPEVLSWSSTPRALFRNGEFVLENTNKLLGKFPGLDGLKTGYTHNAGFCLCATAKRDDLRFLSVVMGCGTNRERFSTSQEILGRAFGSYLRIPICSENDELGKVPVAFGGADSVAVRAPRDLTLIVSRPDDRYLSTRLVADPEITAPLAEGQVIGTLQVVQDERILAEIPVTAAEAVDGGGIATWIRRQLKRHG